MEPRGHSGFFWAALAAAAWLLYRAWRKPEAVTTDAAVTSVPVTTVETPPDVAPAVSVPITTVETLPSSDAHKFALWVARVDGLNQSQIDYVNKVPYVSKSGRTMGPLYDSYIYIDTLAYADADRSAEENEREVVRQIIDRLGGYGG